MARKVRGDAPSRATLKGVVAVPSTAVQSGPQGLFAYVVKPDTTVEIRPVEVGPITGDKAVVESGSSAGETVVTAGHYRLKPGARRCERQGEHVPPGRRS